MTKSPERLKAMKRRTPRNVPLPRNVRVLSWVSLLQDAASEMLYPIMPLFLTTVIGAPVAAVGLIEGLAEGTASLTKIVSGRLADRRARKPMIALGYGISSLAKLLIGLATTWPVVLVIRFGDRVGKGLRTSPRDAMLADATTSDNRGRAFGFHRSMDTAGAVIGPVLGLVLYELLDHQLRPLFFFAFIPAALSVLLVGFVRESHRPVPNGELSDPEISDAESSGSEISLERLPRTYWRTMVFLGLFSLVNFSDALILLRASELGLGFVGVIGAYCLYNLVYATLAFPAGVISDRLPRRLVFAAGLVVFAIAYTSLGLVRSPGWVWVILPLYGIYTALTDGIARAWVADLLPADRRGTGIGTYHGIIGIGAFIASTWAGLAWGSNGQVPLMTAGIVTGIIAFVLAVGGRFFESPS